jgi:hypothetical protein
MCDDMKSCVFWCLPVFLNPRSTILVRHAFYPTICVMGLVLEKSFRALDFGTKHLPVFWWEEVVTDVTVPTSIFEPKSNFTIYL